MRACFLCGLVLLIIGCRTPQANIAPDDFSLGAQDTQLAEALAHYGQGLIAEFEEGPVTPAALLHFTEAAKLAPREYRLQSKAAMALIRQKRHDEAIALLVKAQRQEPRDFRRLLDLATVYQLAGRDDDALEPYRKALALQPENAYLHVAIARIHFARGRDEHALRQLERGVESLPDATPLLQYAYSQAQTFMAANETRRAIDCFTFLAAHSAGQQPQIVHQLGELHEKLGDNDAAKAAFDKAQALYAAALAASPEDLPLHMSQAQLLFHREQDAQALAALQQGVEAAPDRTPLLAFAYRMGQELVSSGAPARAIPCFEFVADNATRDRAKFYHLVGEIRMALGDESGAARSFEKAIEQAEPPAESFIQLALLYGKTDAAKAVDVLRRGDTAIPGNAALLFTLAYSYQATGRTRDAIEVYDRILRSAGADPEQQLKPAFYITYGATCEQAGEFERAVDIFEQCIALYPEEHEALNYVAYMWAEKGIELEKALSYVQRALALEPANGAYLDTLGWIYFRMQRYPEALEFLLKASERIAGDPTILDHLGDVRQALGDTAGAVLAWTQSYARDTSQAAVAEKLKSNGVNPDEIQPIEEDDE